MSQRRRVNVAFQVILCFIPLVWIWGFFRIEKLIAGIIMLVGVTILVIVILMVVPYGRPISWLASVLVPLYFMVKWSQEWNDSISVEYDE